MDIFTYQIGDTQYTQQTMVLGQWEELIPLLSELSFPSTLTIPAIIETFKDKLPRALAIVLREKDKVRWWERDISAVAETLQWEADGETIAAVVTDFFACNPVASHIEFLTSIGRGIGKTAGISQESSVSSLEAT
jgi:hypothetical protein